jgi:flagellar biosynthetic protein FliR
VTWPIFDELGMITFMLVLARTASFISMFPAFGNNTVPTRIKVGAAAAISILLYSNVPHLNALPGHWVQLVLLVLRETMLGLLMGSILRFAFMGAQFAGQTIGVQMGLGAASIYDPGTSATLMVNGRLYYLIAVLLFLGLNLHHPFIENFGRSFKLLPIGSIGPPAGAFHHWASLTGKVLLLGLRLSLPVLGALLILDTALAFMARLVPQMNIFLIGFPLKITLGFTVIALGMGGAGRVLKNSIEYLMQDFESLMIWMR